MNFEIIKAQTIVMAKRAWGRWVRLANAIEADPVTLMVPTIALSLGFWILLFSW